ncbi:hypothetical protein [Hymenobacter guriensis]|uniref:Gliding motility-associated protein GldM first immunoglobulin-like domain-containing protein n=1 Tax=Hymenobacter guriensis TaxID=2793065 RepID=A0ABS0L7U5_9BACT|nr:hypothetical protein [Hymenobacter guriensis]MBG8556225.1 hypothetical protein [Hymenobacter guriensis]
MAGLTLLVACAIGYTFYQQAALQSRLDRQLEELDWTLAGLNERNNQEAKSRLKGIEAATVKNRNTTSDLAVLHAAESLRRQTNALLDTLHARREALLRATGNVPGASGLRRYNETDNVTRCVGSGTPAERQLQQQVAQYAVLTRQPYLIDSVQLALPSFLDAPVVVALAALTQLEADVLAREMRIQQEMARRVGAEKIPSSLRIMASAESNTVAPGEVYRAEFFVTKVLAVKGAQMYCNGRPLEVDADGIGHVRFQAPTRPGPASWQATMRIRVYGRDSTFRLRLPYHVARQ